MAAGKEQRFDEVILAGLLRRGATRADLDDDLAGEVGLGYVLEEGARGLCPAAGHEMLVTP